MRTDSGVATTSPAIKIIKHLSPLMRVAQEVADQFELPVADLVALRAKGAAKSAMQLVLYRCFAETTFPLHVIARRFNRDRTSVRMSICRYCHSEDLPLPRDVSWAAFKKTRPRPRVPTLPTQQPTERESV